MNYQTISLLIVFWFERCDLSCSHSNSDFLTREDNMLFSRVKIPSFRTKAHLVFHWCLYNKSCSWRFDETSNKCNYDVRMLLSMIKFRATWLKILGDINLISSDLTVNHTFVSFQNLTLQSYSIIFFICSVVFVENKTRHFTTEIEIHGNLQSYNDREKSHRQFLRGFFLCWIFSPCNQLWRQDRCCRYCVRQPRMGNICSLPHTFSN